MNDIERFEAAVRQGALLRPSADTPSLVDVARAVAATACVEDFALSAAARSFAGEFGDRDHLVVVLVDGLGARLLDGQPDAAFLRSQRVAEVQTVFPTTTAVALTTLACGEWPGQHAVTGWWTHLPQLGAAAMLLAFIRRSDDQPLRQLGVDPEDVFPTPSLTARMTRDVLAVLPAAFARSVFSGYASGGGERLPYRSLAEGIDLVLRRVREASAPTYTYLYTARVDTTAHEYGGAHPELRAAVLEADRELARLAAGLGGRARLVITSDHGHLATPAGARQWIRQAHDIGELLATAPSGDARVMHFHVREGGAAQFAERFRASFGARFLLFTTDEVKRLELLGPGALSEETRRRLGQFTALSLGADVIGFEGTNGHAELLRQASHHSGLTPDEVLVPLIVA